MADDPVKGPGMPIGGGQAQGATLVPTVAASPATGVSTPSDYSSDVRPGNLLDAWANKLAQTGQQAQDAFTQGNYGYALGRALAAGGLGVGGAIGGGIGTIVGGAKAGADAVGEGIGAVGRGIFGIQDQRIQPPAPPPVVAQVAGVQNAAANNPAQSPAGAPDLSKVTNINDPAYRAFAANLPEQAYTPIKKGDKNDFNVRMPNAAGDAMEAHLNNIPIGLLSQYMGAAHQQLVNQGLQSLQSAAAASTAEAAKAYNTNPSSAAYDTLMKINLQNAELANRGGMPYTAAGSLQ